MNPFAALGLPARPDLTTEEVRAAWRAVAAETHPDRPGGGDIARYTAAAAAYAQLRTPWARSEAYADLVAAGEPATVPLPVVPEVIPGVIPDAPGSGAPRRGAPRRGVPRRGVPRRGVPRRGVPRRGVPRRGVPGPGARAAGLALSAWLIPGRIRRGRPLRLAARALAAAICVAAALRLVPGQPAAPAAVTGVITWFLLTCRADLAPPPGR